MNRPRITLAMLLVIGAVAAAGASAAGKNAYTVHNLVSDQVGVADHVDPNLVNAWGLAAGPMTPWWVADNGKDEATVYQADGTARPLVVQVPEAPDGEVFNGSSGFVVSTAGSSGPATFLFATEKGKILGWNSGVSSTEAVVAVDRSGEDAVFKGLAIGPNRLYATDFHNGKVDVFDASFNPVTAPGAFTDRKLPPGFAPFGIQNIEGNIFVTYAKREAGGDDDVAGPGNGFVDEFDAAGKLLAHVASRGRLNSPWGLALAPASFGRFGDDLLVGNFGDGKINAFALKGKEGKGPHGKAFRGQLDGQDHHAISIDGLWALQFGQGGANNGPTGTLFFTAGPDDESHGLFGTILPAS